MSDATLSRRQAAGLAAAFAALAATPALANNPHLDNARNALMQAKGHLEQAEKSGHGHRAKALELTVEAIEQVQQAIAAKS